MTVVNPTWGRHRTRVFQIALSGIFAARAYVTPNPIVTTLEAPVLLVQAELDGGPLSDIHGSDVSGTSNAALSSMTGYLDQRGSTFSAAT